MDWSRLCPRVDEGYVGPRWALYFLALVAAVGTVRSLIHMLASDGGAQSIAGLAVGVEGGRNIVAVFGQWGASQLVLALLVWLVVLRYRFLVPGMLAATLLEQLLRLGVGQLKPMQVATVPPGAIGSWILLPLSCIALCASLRGGTKAEG
jgi:hypothetical protein